MGGGAWPFLVGEVICQVYSDNGRDLTGVFLTVMTIAQDKSGRAKMPREGEAKTGP